MEEERASFPVRIPPFGLDGALTPPRAGKGIVLFAHGSGSGRFSPRNNRVARGLQDAGLGTLLFDLLSPVEAADRANVFDIDLLALRLTAATDWLSTGRPLGQGDAGPLPLGYFGASTGAAAALVAATSVSHPIGAIVSRGGRPDLAGAALERVRAPTLLIVGSLDVDVLMLNRTALDRLRCEREIAVIDGAGHLFEEPGALGKVAGLAEMWFGARLATPGG